MCSSDEEETQRVLIDAAIKASGILHQAAWARYVEYTGLVDTFEIYAYLKGLVSLPVVECNLLAHAVNELIDERPSPPRAPHRSTAPGAGSAADLGIGIGIGIGDDAIDGLLKQWGPGPAQ